MATINPTAGSPYRVPPEPSRWPSIALAAAVHAGLLAFLFIGVSWQNNEPVAVEAEVWDMKTQAAAPTPPPPREVIAPEPTPQPEPAPTPPPPREVVQEPPAPKVDIALEREKKRAEQKKLLAEEQRLEEKLQRERDAKEEKARALTEKKEQAKAEKKAQALADKKLEDKKQAEKQLADKQKGEKLAKAKAEAADQAKVDKLRDAEMKRMMAGTGEAAKSTAPKSDPGYLAAISTKVKSSTSYSGSTDVPGNPAAEFTIEQLPTGEIMNVRLVKSSGVKTFDDAVEKGIIKASPLPKKKDGTVVRTVTIAFKMKDMN